MSDDIYNHKTTEALANIPPDLKALPNFVCWRHKQTTAKNGTAKYTKIPITADGSPASSTDPSTWMPFEIAAVAHKDGTGDGVGLCVPTPINGKVLVGLDWDVALTADLEFSGWPTFDLESESRYAETYSEVTPSGRGFRSYFWLSESVANNLSANYRHEYQLAPHDDELNKTPGIEWYFKGRYFTLTGLALNERSAPVVDGDKIVPALLERVSAAAAQFCGSNSKTESTTPAASSTTTTPTTTEAPATVSSDIEELADAITSKRKPTESRHNLIFALSGVLFRQGWKRKRLADLMWALMRRLYPELSEDALKVEYGHKLKMLDDLPIRQFHEKAISSWTALKRFFADDLMWLESRVKGTNSTGNAKQVLALLPTWTMSRMNVAPVEYLRDPFILKNAITAVTGESGCGKSTWVTSLLFDIASGSDVRVIYVDRDNPAAITKYRNELVRGNREDSIHYWGEYSVDADANPVPTWNINDSRWVELVGASEKHVVLVFDSFVDFLEGADENNNSAVNTLMLGFRKIVNAGATVIVIHHTGKSATSKSYRGAGAFKSAVDRLWVVTEKRRGDNIESQIIRPDKGRIRSDVEFAQFRWSMKDDHLEIREVVSSKEQSIFTFIAANCGKSKNQLETLVKKSGLCTRQELRDVIDRHLCAKKLVLKNSKLYTPDVARLADLDGE